MADLLTALALMLVFDGLSRCLQQTVLMTCPLGGLNSARLTSEAFFTVVPVFDPPTARCGLQFQRNSCQTLRSPVLVRG